LNYWYFALIGLGIALLFVILFKDEILKASQYLGRGEFSENFLNDKGFVLKKSALNSLYNPDTTNKDRYLNRNINMLKSEVKTYNKLKKGNYSILPNKFYAYKEKDTGKYVIVKEYGEIPVDPNSKLFLPKWKPGSVKQEKYNKFTKELYLIAKHEGHFEDHIQPALRKNGDLFITDLGLFVSYEDQISNDRIVKKSRNDFKISESERRRKYREVNDKLRHLDEQLGIKHKVPDFVIKENLNHLYKEHEKRKEISELYAENTTGSQIEFWESKK